MALQSDHDTYVVRRGVSPNTVSEISSKTKIYAKPTAIGDADSGEDIASTQVGVIASFDPNESRSIEPVRGIGFGDQVAELIPGVTEPMTISIVRTAQYLANVYQVFGYKGGVAGLVRSLKHHRWPFDIRKETVFSEIVNGYAGGNEGSSLQDETNPIDSGDSLKALVTMYEGCWFQDWSTSYSSDTALVQENCSMMVSDVYDGTNHVAQNSILDTGNKNQSVRFTSPLA
jgi:hypothetical protein